MTAPTHVVIGFAVGSAVVSRPTARFQLLVCATCAVLPDLDLMAPWLGGDRDFHRRFTHSVAFALIVGLACATGNRLARHQRAESIHFGCSAALATLSHAITDMMTTSPPGVALLSPFSNVRNELPWRPITSVTREIGFVLLPALLAGITLLWLRNVRMLAPKTTSPVVIQLR